MLHGSIRLSVLAGAMAFGAAGLTLALLGVGVPYLVASALAGVAAGLVMYAALRAQPEQARAVRMSQPAEESGEEKLREQLEAYREHSSAMRHDLRGMLSPALMMSDRLLTHEDPKIQRAGQAVVKSIERATALLTDSKVFLTPEDVPPRNGRVTPRAR